MMAGDEYSGYWRPQFRFRRPLDASGNGGATLARLSGAEQGPKTGISARSCSAERATANGMDRLLPPAGLAFNG